MGIFWDLYSDKGRQLTAPMPDFPTVAKRSGGFFGGLVDDGGALAHATPPDPSAPMTSLGKSANYLFGSTLDVR